jgi:hypothetical protein
VALVEYRRLVHQYYRLHPSGRRVAQLRLLNLVMIVASVGVSVMLLGLASGAFFGVVGSGVMWLTYRQNSAA